MLFKNILSALVLGVAVTAHHLVSEIHINGVPQGPGKCLRLPPSTAPVVDVNSNDMACNVGGTKGVARVCPIDAGSSITFRWRSWPNGDEPGSLDTSHQGPCAVYMKKVNDATTSPAAGAGWFKIYHEGFVDGKFCSQRLIENGGFLRVTIPKDLPGGDYIIRAEQLALHQAQTVGGAQWYMGCAQIVVSGTGGNAYPTWYRIPGHVSPRDPGVLYDYWNTKVHSTYKVPGPSVYKVGKGGSAHAIENRKERGSWNCVVENANWCGRKLNTFNSEGSCWEAVSKCWDQLDACYESAPVTGSRGCNKFGEICQRAQDHCHSCGRGCNGSFPN